MKDKIPALQAPALHVRISVSNPRFCCKQIKPPPAGGGFVHVRVLLCVPTPHDTEHVSQAPQRV